MCGIVGMLASHQNGFDRTELDVFGDMLFMDSMRGWDSTGAFLVAENGNVHILKDAIQGGVFIKTQEYKSLEGKAWRSGMFLVGHNRAATRGSVNKENAHPFWPDDKIVLVQNGTYVGCHKHIADVEVDSNAIAHHLVKEPDVEKALQQINAAYALVWYDVRTKTLHAIRNKERPLWIAKSKSGATLFASESLLIVYAAHRRGMELAALPELIEEHELFQWRLDPNKKMYYSSSNVIKGEYVHPFTTGYAGLAGSAIQKLYPVDVWRPPSHRSKDTVGFSTHIYSHELFAHRCDTQQLEELQQTLSKYKENTTQYIETTDFLPASVEDTEGKADWYIYGQPVEISGQADPIGPVIYFLVKNKTRQQIIRCLNDYPFVALTTPHPRGVTYSVTPVGTQKPYYVVACMGHTPTTTNGVEITYDEPQLKTEEHVH